MNEPEPNVLHAALKGAVEKADNNQSRFAAAIGTSQQLVSYWLKNGRPLPAEFVLAAERAGFGDRHDLRPDLYPRENSEPNTPDDPPPFPNRTLRTVDPAPGASATHKSPKGLAPSETTASNLTTTTFCTCSPNSLPVEGAKTRPNKGSAARAAA